MSEEHTITYSLDIDNAKATASMMELNRLLTTYVALARRGGLPPDAIEIIAIAQRMRLAVQSLIRSIQMFYAAAGPLGWLIGLGGIGLTWFMAYDIGTELASH